MIDLFKVARKAYLKMMMKGHLNDSHYIFNIKNNFDTATWTYIKKGTKYINYIYIGDNATKMALSEKNEAPFVTDLIYHEVGHSLYTYRDLAFVKTAIELHNVPFQLFNLFEDCRMEHRVSQDLEHNFQWIKNVNPYYYGFAHTHPESLLLSIKSYCGEVAVPTKAFLEQCDNEFVPLVTAEKLAKRIHEYYLRIIECKETLDLLPILIEWRNEFTTDEEKSQEELIERLKELAQHILEKMLEDGIPFDDDSGENSGSELIELSDLELSDELSNDADDKSSFDADCDEVINTEKQDEKKADNLGKGQKHDDDFVCNTVSIDEFTDFNLLRKGEEYGEAFDRGLVKKITPKFKKVLDDKHRKIATTRPSKRFHPRNLVLDREKLYKRKEETSRTRKEVSLIYDCSGSMYSVIAELKSIAAVFNNLSKSGQASGNLILSSDEGYQTFRFPIHEEEVIDKMAGVFGGEGINQTMHSTLPLLTKSDLVFVITDGDICDEEVEKKFFARKGVDPIGLYIGDEAINLSRWFRRYICRKSIESLVDELVRKLK